MSKKRILFAEDDDMSRDVIATRLQRSGYDVVVVEDGQKALQSVATDSFDLVILDMSMPVLAGWEVAARLKANPATAGIPILALSALAMTPDRKKALEAGCGDFDSKPVNLQRLLGKIEALLAKSAPAESVTR